MATVHSLQTHLIEELADLLDSARTYAKVLGKMNVARLLERTLDEEKAADLTLTKIAEGSVNEEAAKESQAQDEGGALIRTAEWAGSAAATASLHVAKGLRHAVAAVGMAQERSVKDGGSPRTDARRNRTSARPSRRMSKKR